MAMRRLSGDVGEASPPSAPRSDNAGSVEDVIAGLADLGANALRLQWRNHLGGTPPAHLPRWLLLRVLAYQIQVAALGGPDKATLRVIRQPKGRTLDSAESGPFEARIPSTREGADSQSGSAVGPRVEGQVGKGDGPGKGLRLEWQVLCQPFADRQGDDRHSLERPPLLRLANGDVRPRCASAPRAGERGDRQAGCRVGRTYSKQTSRSSPLFTKRCGRFSCRERGRRLTEDAVATTRRPRHEARQSARRACAAPSIPASRPSTAWSRSSTRSTTSGKHQRPTSRARPTKAGG